MKKILVMAAVMLFGVMGANAAGTDYGTTITNSVTLSYEVGGNAQTDIAANDGAGFLVDRKVDVLVATTNLNNQIVNPGDNVATDDHALTFTVTNESNGNQDFTLSLENLATGVNTLDAGETDNIDFATDLKICTDNPCTNVVTGLNQSFTEDELKTYYVFADIPVGTADGSLASIALKATAVDDGTTTVMTDDSGNADDPVAVQVVFADDAGVAAGDIVNHGEHSALSAYEVQAAVLAVTKASCVLSDPVNATNPKRIPGAVIRYEIQIVNSGSGDATSVEITDTLNAAAAAAFNNTAANIEVRSLACPGTDATTNACGTRAGVLGTNANTTGAGTNTITLDYDTVAAGETECGYFEVTMQ